MLSRMPLSAEEHKAYLQRYISKKPEESEARQKKKRKKVKALAHDGLRIVDNDGACRYSRLVIPLEPPHLTTRLPAEHRFFTNSRLPCPQLILARSHTAMRSCLTTIQRKPPS